MLTAIEQVEVTALLVARVVGDNSPRQTLVAFLDAQLAARIGEGDPQVLVERVLRVCQDDGDRLDPPALVKLLQNLLPSDPTVEQILERITIRPAQRPDPFEAVVLRNNLPFLDRADTRLAVREIVELPRPRKPVIVVNQMLGEAWRKCGKSYTTAYVDHVLQDLRTHLHCYIEVREGQGAAVGPPELARDLVTYMGGDPGDLPARDTNAAQWTNQLANWVMSVANRSDYQWWFILDGFNNRELRADTKELIVKLASSLDTGIQQDRHRLILIDFDRAHLVNRPGRVSDQRTAPIPHTSVTAAVRQIMAAAPAGIDHACVAAEVLRGLPDPVTDLPELNQRLESVILEAAAHSTNGST